MAGTPPLFSRTDTIAIATTTNTITTITTTTAAAATAITTTTITTTATFGLQVMLLETRRRFQEEKLDVPELLRCDVARLPLQVCSPAAIR